MKAFEIDCEAGEAVLRDMTVEETAQRQADEQDAAERAQQNATEETNWRAKLLAEIDFIDAQLASWPPNATNNTTALERVNFVLGATKRIARNQNRILKFIRDNTRDSA